MKKSKKAASTMKRVLITVPGVSGARFCHEMQGVVDSLLIDGLRSSFYSMRYFPQKILDHVGNTVAYLSECSWLPICSGECPPEFVLNLPAWMWKEGVPEYTGEIRKEAK
jgi:hypothetical protein